MGENYHPEPSLLVLSRSKTELPPTEESVSLCLTCETKRWESLTVEYSIPISNTLIRDLNGSPSLHKSVSNSNSSSAHTVYSDSFLARRFSDQGFRSTNSCSLERLEASVEEDKTVEAECGDALAESLPRVS
jgi:hypothetical protein